MKAKVMESVILHASDAIYWVDGSGLTPTRPRQPVPQRLSLTLDKPPSNLKLVEKAGAVLLWRNQGNVVAGKATDAQKKREPENTYPIKGQITDPSQVFNPRSFELTAGNAVGREVLVYRSPFGTRTRKQGFLFGTLIYQDLVDQNQVNKPASWALLELSVTVITQPQVKKQTFQAQADGNGDFVLSLGGLPFIKKDATNKTYSAILKIKGAHDASDAEFFDPDKLEAFKIKADDSENFSTELALELTPDSILRITSKSASDNKPVVLKK